MIKSVFVVRRGIAEDSFGQERMEVDVYLFRDERDHDKISDLELYINSLGNCKKAFEANHIFYRIYTL